MKAYIRALRDLERISIHDAERFEAAYQRLAGERRAYEKARANADKRSQDT